jgi:NADPH-dependent ferric siderophore reductase
MRQGLEANGHFQTALMDWAMILEMFQRTPRARVIGIVLQALDVTPHMRRLVLGGPEIAAWLATAGINGPAAWVKVFCPERDPRVYTIRRVNMNAATLEIDFMLRDNDTDSGSISEWARRARCGDLVGIAGPRCGAFSLLPESRWVWLAADATALPAAQTILASLPSRTQAHALLVVDACEDQQDMESAAPLRVEWRYTHQSAGAFDVSDAVMRGIDSLDGPGQVWLAGESDWVHGWKSYWFSARLLDARRMSAEGYWRRGEQDYRD